MLTLHVPDVEYFDEKTERFIKTKAQTLHLEHSLISISKWESKWHKPFLSKEDKTEEQTLDYIKCMTINSNVDPLVYRALDASMISQINSYIDDPMTATWFNERQTKKGSREVITSEVIYYWMISLDIPFDCEKWHLNRLLTLVKVCDLKNSPGRKMSKRDILNSNRELNALRKQRLHTKG